MDENALTRMFQEGGPYDKESPTSLYNIMPREARATFDNMEVAMLLMDEAHLEKRIKPTPYLNQVRTAFWKEYDAAQSTQTKMTIKGIQKHIGTYSPSVLLREYLMAPATLSWILIPPTHYDSLVDEALDRGLRRIQQIIDMPMEKPDGTLDHKAAELIMKAVAFLDLRKNGMPMQRSEIKQLSVNVSKGDLKQLGSMKGEDIDQKIRELEERLVIEHSSSGRG